MGISRLNRIVNKTALHIVTTETAQPSPRDTVVPAELRGRAEQLRRALKPAGAPALTQAEIDGYTPDYKRRTGNFEPQSTFLRWVAKITGRKG